MVYENGDVFEGEWEKRERKFGKLTYQNGEIWEGPFGDNQPHGEGHHTSNGERRKALFEKG